VTLAESQGKKASFLREAVRSLGIAAEVYAGRVEEMPSGRAFDAVALRAVDAMKQAVREGAARVNAGGWLVMLVSAGSVEVPAGFFSKDVQVPGAMKRVIVLAQRADPARCST
jgi:16S rRNA (guanine527-N7)-methyltransferase